MNLSDYFNPVELEKPELNTNLGNSVFHKNIYTHTINSPVNNLNGIDLVILGIGEDRNARIKGAADAPDFIRSKLYQLSSIKNIHIADLGNFKTGKEINDTYVGLSDVYSYLHSQKVNCLVIGGSNDLIFPFINNEINKQKETDVTFIDARIDFEMGVDQYHSENFINHLLDSQGEYKLYINNLGYQNYLNNSDAIVFLESDMHNLNRLGIVRQSIEKFEPVLRSSDIVSIDICAVKQSEAQGQYNPSPNGFTGEEVCQLAWYSGQSEKTMVFGIFDVIPNKDINMQTSGLAAQIAWHYIYGVANRYHEYPGKTEHFKKFIIGLETNNQNISFYKSNVSDRWWLEITNNNPGFEKVYVPCNQEDYNMACNHEIPDVWWKACQRYNIVK